MTRSCQPSELIRSARRANIFWKSGNQERSLFSPDCWENLKDVFQSDAGVYTCEAANSEGEISAVLTIEEKENMPEVFEEFLEEVPEMIKDIQETSGAAGSGPITFLLSSVLVVVTVTTLRNNA